MVTPVGNGIQQQLPIGNTFQPGGTSEQARAERERREDKTEETSPALKSQKTDDSKETENRSPALQAASTEGRDEERSGDQRRGSVLDITV